MPSAGGCKVRTMRGRSFFRNFCGYKKYDYLCGTFETQLRVRFDPYLKSTINLKSKIMNLKTAHAGTLESGDILVQIFPAAEGEGLTVNLDSSVAFQFGKQIKKVITETLQERGVTDAVVNATDKGALDCTIRARVTAAAVRATGVDVWND